MIARAAEEIARGRVVGVPTDALYVLVADPLNLQAVGSVYASKGRDTVRSLPLAISDLLMAEDLGKELDSRFYILARHFWPGPLDHHRAGIGQSSSQSHRQYRPPRSASGQIKTLNAIIEKIGHALIATSANISGEPTLCSGIELFAAMDGRIDLVLEGGLCVGPGPTTMDMTEPYWSVIKEGAISEKEIAERQGSR